MAMKAAKKRTSRDILSKKIFLKPSSKKTSKRYMLNSKNKQNDFKSKTKALMPQLSRSNAI